MKSTNLRKILGEKVFGERVANIVEKIEFFLNKKDKILDLGAGRCLYAKSLKDKGYKITAVDVADYSYYPDIKVIVYDGRTLPFKDNEFDICLLRSILHHTTNPYEVLKETARVSKKLIVYENTVTNIFQRYYTYTIDCIMNKELIEPHTNKTDKQWQLLFRKLSLKIVKIISASEWLFLKDKIYFLSKI